MSITPTGFFFGQVDSQTLPALPEGWLYVIDPEDFLFVTSPDGEFFFVEKIADDLRITAAPLNPARTGHEHPRRYDASNQRVLCAWRVAA